MVTVQELENAKIDARTIGESVNENKTILDGTPPPTIVPITDCISSAIIGIDLNGAP